MVRTGNVDFSCKRLTSIEIRKSKYHIIRRVRFRWDPPPPPPRERYLDPRLVRVRNVKERGRERGGKRGLSNYWWSVGHVNTMFWVSTGVGSSPRLAN